MHTHPRPQEFRDRNEPGSLHRDAVDRVRYVAAADKYVTCSRDGSFRRVALRPRLVNRRAGGSRGKPLWASLTEAPMPKTYAPPGCGTAPT